MESGNTGFLIAYDVRCPKRLARLHRFLAERCVAVQYSVFAAYGDHRWAARLALEISKYIDCRQDDVRIYSTPKRTKLYLIDSGRAACDITLASSHLPELLKHVFQAGLHDGDLHDEVLL